MNYLMICERKLIKEKPLSLPFRSVLKVMQEMKDMSILKIASSLQTWKLYANLLISNMIKCTSNMKYQFQKVWSYWEFAFNNAKEIIDFVILRKFEYALRWGYISWSLLHTKYVKESYVSKCNQWVIQLYITIRN